MSARYWIHTCGHTSTCDPWGRGEKAHASLCHDCQTARLGETIACARYGLPPKSGVSRNHREQVAEAGVSVYEIVGGAIQHVGWYFGFLERPLYLGTGVIVGWGSDGEPLVQVVSLRKATKKQAAQYVSA